MDLTFSPEDEAFRQEVRQFLAETLPANLARRVRLGQHLGKSETEAWQATLNAPAGPRPIGRRLWRPGWSVTQRFICDAGHPGACAARRPVRPRRCGARPDEVRHRGAEALLAAAHPGRQRLVVPGLSRSPAPAPISPRSRRRPMRDGDHYVVNGQKTWTTLGQHADMMLLPGAHRPEGAQAQEGISFLLVDMKTPGLTVRPIITARRRPRGQRGLLRQCAGPGREPASARRTRAGPTPSTCSTTSAPTSPWSALGGGARRAQDVAPRRRRAGRPLAEDPFFAARWPARDRAGEHRRSPTCAWLDAAVAHGAAPTAESSMLKISRHRDPPADPAIPAAAPPGPYAQPICLEALAEGYNGEPVGQAFALGPFVASHIFQLLASSRSSAASNEVQREIITKAQYWSCCREKKMDFSLGQDRRMWCDMLARYLSVPLWLRAGASEIAGTPARL